MPVNLNTSREYAYNRGFGSNAGSAAKVSYQYTPSAYRMMAASIAASAAQPQDTFGTNVKTQLPFLAAFEGIPFLTFLYRNHKLGGIMSNDLAKLGKTTNLAFKNIFKGKNGTIFERIGRYFKAANDNKNALSHLNAVTGAKRAVQTAAAAGKTVSAETAAKAAEKITASTGKGGVKGLLQSSGAKTMLMFSGAIEGIFEVLPAFKNLGFEKGVKQTVKSAVKVSAETAGFIAGDCIGTAIGSAIGTAIFPGIGTVIGAAAGFIAGGIGSIYAGKLAKKITGKSENEIAKEEKAQKMQLEFLKRAEIENKEKLKNNPFNPGC